MTFSKYFDHTLLKPEATEEDIRRLCEEAVSLDVCAVCVNSQYVKTAKACLEGSGIRVASVVGFPLGAMAPQAKAFEATQALRDGADEIDMVIPIGAAKAGDYEAVYKDVRAVREALETMVFYRAGQDSPVLKVILEVGLLTEEEIRGSGKAAIRGGADFLKTSTGFGPGGATAENVALLKEIADEYGEGDVKVKASGGIRDRKTAEEMITAGAERLGTSATAAILKD